MFGNYTGTNKLQLNKKKKSVLIPWQFKRPGDCGIQCHVSKYILLIEKTAIEKKTTTKPTAESTEPCDKKKDRLTFVSYGIKINSHTVLISHLVLLLKGILQQYQDYFLKRKDTLNYLSSSLKSF